MVDPVAANGGSTAAGCLRSCGVRQLPRRLRAFGGAALGLAGVGAPAAPASAQSHAVRGHFVDRPLVLPEGVVRIDGGPKRPSLAGQVSSAGQLQFLLSRPGSDVALLAPGAAYGLSRGWELGAVWPLLLSPDIDLRDVSIYAKRMLRSDGELQLAAFGEVRVPIESDLALTAGAPLQLRLRPDVRVDAGAFLGLIFGDDAIASLHLPVAVPVALSSEWSFAPDLAVTLVDFDSLDLPIGVTGVYTVGRGLRVLGDAFVRLGFIDLSDADQGFRLDLGFDFYLDP